MARSALPLSQRQYAHVNNGPAQRLARRIAGPVPAPIPDYIPPALATLTSRPPSGEDWLHEIKFDGYRVQLHISDAAGLQVFTRRGHDWTSRFSNLAAASRLLTHAAVIDGEVIVQAATGLSDFGALERDLGAGRTDRFVCFAFDLLYLDGLDLRPARLIDRKRVLAILLEGFHGPIRYSDHEEGQGSSLYKSACEMKLEGLVSKRADSRYESGRTNSWIKVTCRKRDTFVVAGVALKAGKFNGIYLARERDGDLVYAGKVEHGFTRESEKDLLRRAEPLFTRRQPLAEPIKKPKAKWLQPALLVDVEYRALTGDGKLRHPSFKGVRHDLMDESRPSS